MARRLKAERVVGVAVESWREAVCMSRFLDLKGAPSALHPVYPEGRRKYEVRVKVRHESRARKLLATRHRGTAA